MLQKLSKEDDEVVKLNQLIERRQLELAKLVKQYEKGRLIFEKEIKPIELVYWDALLKLVIGLVSWLDHPKLKPFDARALHGYIVEKGNQLLVVFPDNAELHEVLNGLATKFGADNAELNFDVNESEFHDNQPLWQKPQKGKKSKKEKANEALVAEQSKIVSQLEKGLVKKVYAHLAKMHHPDLVTDETLHHDKTELMKDINKAYQGKDINSLMQLIQTNGDKSSPELSFVLDKDVFSVYIKMLNQQSQSLNNEILDYKQGDKYKIFVQLASGTEIMQAAMLRSYLHHLNSEIEELNDSIQLVNTDIKGVTHFVRNVILYDE